MNLEKRIKKLEDDLKKVLGELNIYTEDEEEEEEEEEEENEENEECFFENKIEQQRYTKDVKDVLDTLFDKDEYGIHRIGGISHQRLKEFKMYYKTHGKIAIPKNFIQTKENLKMLTIYFDSPYD
jgi:CRISPR/Cas system-associated protein Cas10 (large subunit of type III CRISPR-Cas system)